MTVIDALRSFPPALLSTNALRVFTFLRDSFPRRASLIRPTPPT
jgi:hypothetical protein